MGFVGFTVFLCTGIRGRRRLPIAMHESLVLGFRPVDPYPELSPQAARMGNQL